MDKLITIPVNFGKNSEKITKKQIYMEEIINNITAINCQGVQSAVRVVRKTEFNSP